MKLVQVLGVLFMLWFRTDRTEATRGTQNWAAAVPRLSTVVRRVDRRFLSVAIGAGLAADEKFMYLLSSPKLRTLTRALTPALLRFGGTKQDFMVFTPQKYQLDSGYTAENTCNEKLPQWLEENLKKDWVKQKLQKMMMTEDLQRKYQQIKFTENTVDMLHSFANCSGMEMIFGLNALLRTANNSWNSSNAQLLLDYCQSRNYSMSWALGNEPNSFVKKAGIRVDGFQLGQDFIHLREILSKTKLYRDAGLYGPDISQPRGHGTYLLGGFLETGAKALSACTWHHYYVDSKNTSLEDFVDPDVLDSLALKINEVLGIVKQESPGKRVWLGETGSAYGGGAPGLSDTFVAGFMWLDKLGLAAKLGVDLVMRQVLFGAGYYQLIDDNLDPLPDYWLSLLYKRLVGPEVLEIKSAGSKSIRLYLHCANRNSYRSGAVTLMSMNLSNKPATITVPALASSRTVEAFVLESDQPGEEGLRSSLIKLNGDVLKMVDDKTLPDLRGRLLPPSEHLELPAFSLAFFVITDAQAAGCT